MTITAKDLVASPAFFAAIRVCAQQMVEMYAENPRLASIFASQQRWLMAQTGLALYYEKHPGDPATGLYAGRFVGKVLAHKIASRNTAAAFLQEMLAYRFVRASDNPPDRRMRPIEPTETAYRAVWRWLNAHLLILDTLDGGGRAQNIPAGDPAFARIQPRIAAGLLDSAAVRHPGKTFDLFTWANSGGVVMDYFIARIEAFDPQESRVRIGAVAASEICQLAIMSKTHLKRLLNKATEMGSLGTEHIEGRHDVWLSQTFVKEYLAYQAEKFAIIETAYHVAMAPLDGAAPATTPTAALST